MSDFTFLNKGQVFNESMLNIFKIRGANAETTDYALLLGARKNTWWTKDSYSLGLIEIKNETGNAVYDCRSRMVGARPAIPCSALSDKFKNLTRKEDGILEVECGEYPQTIVSQELSTELENAYQNQSLVKTEKIYTIDGTEKTEYTKGFAIKELEEYTYKGKKYVRIEGNNNNLNTTLSNQETVVLGKGYWVEVEPIKWLIDDKTFLTVSEKILFSGVRFDAKRHYQNILSEAEIKRYMDIFFAKEIEPSKEIKLEQEKTTQKVKVQVRRK